jgi:hypothetical protein
VAEFRSDQFGRVGVNDIARLQDLALLHEVLDHVHRAFGHTLGKFLDRDGFRHRHFAHDLLARLVVHRALELLLAPAHGRQRTRTRIAIFRRKRRVERQLATTAIFLGLGRLGWLGKLWRHETARRQCRRRGAATVTRLGLFLFVATCLLGSLRRATACFFLGTAACLGLGLDASLFLGLTAGRILALALAAFFFVGATLGILGSTLAIFHLACLRALERPATGFHFATRQLVQHHAAAVGLRWRRRTTLLLHGRRGLLRPRLRLNLLRRDLRLSLRLRRLGLRRSRLRREHRLRGRSWLLLARLHELALGLDHDLLSAAMRKILAHGALLDARALQRQCLLGRNTQRLVVARIRITHSISSAASSSPATAAIIARSSGEPPR